MIKPSFLPMIQMMADGISKPLAKEASQTFTSMVGLEKWLKDAS